MLRGSRCVKSVGIGGEELPGAKRPPASILPTGSTAQPLSSWIDVLLVVAARPTCRPDWPDLAQLQPTANPRDGLCLSSMPTMTGPVYALSNRTAPENQTIARSPQKLANLSRLRLARSSNPTSCYETLETVLGIGSNKSDQIEEIRMMRPRCSSDQRIEGLPQVVLQVLRVFQTHRQADQIIADAAGSASFRGIAGVRHRRRMFNE